MTRPSRRNAIAVWRIVFASLATLILSANIFTAAENGPAVGELLKTGWQIAGLSSGLRQPVHLHTVSASGAKLSRAMPRGYDVTRTPSTYSICYKLL